MVSFFKNDNPNSLPILKKDSEKLATTGTHRSIKQREIFGQKVPSMIQVDQTDQTKNATTRKIFSKIITADSEITTLKKPKLIKIGLGSKKKDPIKNTRAKLNRKLPGFFEGFKDKIKVNKDGDFPNRRNKATERNRYHLDYKITPRSRRPHHLKISKVKKHPENYQSYNYKYDVENEAEFNHEEVSSGNRTQGAFGMHSSDVEFNTTYSVLPGSGFQAITSYSIVSNTGY